MIAVTGSDSLASDPAPLGEPEEPRASAAENPYPRRRDLRNSDKTYSPDDPEFAPIPESETEPAEVAAKDYGKAGRNLPAAIGIGLLIGGIVLASLIFLPISFIFIILVAIVAAMWELANALSRSGSLVSRVPTMISAACMVVATYVGGREALWVTFAASAGAVMLFTMVERRKNAVKDVSLSLFA
ncbi:MAG: phosphatidate cytidylyltransferase, partial [Brevibacterium sp.]